MELKPRTRRVVRAVQFAALIGFALANPSASQEGIRPGDDRLETPPLQAPTPVPDLELPPPPTPSPEAEGRLSGGIQIDVRRIRVDGSTVFSGEELAALVAPFEGRRIGAQGLYRARDAVTQLYHDNGYITSGAILPDQEVDDGVVVLRIVEGRLHEIDVRGSDRFRESYFRDRLEWAGRTPVSIWRIETALQLIQQHPLIERVSARLVPGDRLGESRLELAVDENLPAELDLGASNFRSVSVGEFAGESHASLSNLLGIADRLAADFTVAEGLYDFDSSYSVPFTRFDTRIGVHFRDSRGLVVLPDFNRLDIKSKSRTLGFSLEQPLARDFGRELRLGLIGELRRSETRISNRNFCTIAGKPNAGPGGSTPVVDAPDCHPTVAALRFFQQYQLSAERSAIALRSMFSFGLDMLSATRNSNSVADGRFVAWLGQIQYVYRLPTFLLDSQVVARFDTQLSSDPLLSLEKFSIGGSRTVRGYRENELVRDNGVVAAIEVRIPVLPRNRSSLQLSFVPFVDVGRGWDESGPGKLETDTLVSLGAGIMFRLYEGIRGEFFYGGRLTGTSGEDGSGLQQHGMHFRVTIDTLTPWR